MFRYANVNPNKAEINDCTIRAISVAEGISWDEAYEELSTQARRKGLMMDSVEFVESYLDKHYKRVNLPKGLTVQDIAEDFSSGTYLVTMKGHITIVKDGIVFDTFDCRDRLVRDVWKVFTPNDYSNYNHYISVFS